MCTCDMPRKPRLFRLDDRVLKGLDALAGDAKTNTNQFVESILFEFLKHAGKLPKEAEQLKDGRGGKRKKKQLPNDPADTADSLSKDSSGSLEERSPSDEEPIDVPKQ